MQRLTLEIAIENKFSPMECVKFYDQDLDDKHAEDILWAHTCFPFDTEIMLTQLFHFFESYKKDEGAIE